MNVWKHLICIHLAMSTDPGAVPKNAMPPLEEDSERDYENGGER